MNNMRKVLASLIAALLLVSLSFATSRSHANRATAPQKNIQAQPEIMNAEEKIVRDVYARLMRYQSASRDEVDAREGKQSTPEDYLTFELRNFRSGPMREIQNRRLGELATPPNSALITIKPVRLAAPGGPQHAYYEAEWTLKPEAGAQSRGGNDARFNVAVKDEPRFAPFDHYTSYEVRAHLQGKSFRYRALALYQVQSAAAQASSRPSIIQFIDNVTSDMNTVYSDESALARAPWDKYVKTSLYRAVAKSIQGKLDLGEPLRTKDAPIGYVAGDDVAQLPIDGGGGGDDGGGGEPPPDPTCQTTTVASLEARLPSTRNPITNAAPADGIYNTTNASTAFGLSSSTDLAVVFQSTETRLTVTAMGVNPSTAANTLRWRVDRDPTDSVGTGTPTLSTLTGASTVITPNVSGNFRLICYVDMNSNSAYDSGEERRVMRFATVAASIQTSFIRTTANFAGGANSVGVQNAMDLSIDILLTGGGANAKIGVDKVVLGNVGDLWAADSFQVNYPVPVPTPPAPANVVGTENENPGGPIPMVDTVRVTQGNQPTGALTPFRGNSHDTAVGDGPGAVGQIRRVTSLDAPAFGWDFFHPVTTNPWGSTQGGNTFREFIVGFSVTFSPQRNYVVFAVGDWVAIATGNNAGGTWTTNGAQVTIQGGTATTAAMTNRISAGSPQTGNTSGVQVLGLSFVNEFRMDHTP